MSSSDDDMFEDEDDTSLSNIRAMLQSYYGTEDSNANVRIEDVTNLDSSKFDLEKYKSVCSAYFRPYLSTTESLAWRWTRWPHSKERQDRQRGQGTWHRHAEVGVWELLQVHERHKDHQNITSISPLSVITAVEQCRRYGDPDELPVRQYGESWQVFLHHRQPIEHQSCQGMLSITISRWSRRSRSL